MKAQVTERALAARVRRALQKDGIDLKTCRADSKWFNDTGRWYTVDLATNSLRDRHIDLEGWAREMGLLKSYEEVAE